MDIRLIDEPDAVGEGLTWVTAPVVGVDVERADGQHYFRAAALVQVGAEQRCALFDALVLGKLPDLDHFLDARLTVLHALENDLEALDAAAIRPPRLADTALAAAMLGLPTGLGPLLSQVLSVELGEDKERFQRADWSVRPLPEEMTTYAAADVVHLPSLWETLELRLLTAGRFSWYEQELAAAIRRAHEPRGWTRTKGLARLDGHGRAILRQLWEEREAIARGEDIAPQRIARDEALVALADDPPATLGGLVTRGMRRRQVRDYGDRLLQAVRRGSRSPDEPSPFGLRRPTAEDRAISDRLRRERAAAASELGLDPGVLCPGHRLLRAVLADPAGPEELGGAAGLLPWQREVLAGRLWGVYATGRRTAPR